MSDDLDLTPQERNLIRSEFMTRISDARSIHEGILVKRWSTGRNKGQPKPTAAVQSMLDRGLLEMLDTDSLWLCARFTPRGFEALRRMAADKRALSERDHGHLRDEIAGLLSTTDVP